MSHSLVTALALALLGQAGGPEIVDNHSTYGYLGAPRPRAGAMPGDVAHFSFGIKNLKADAKGRVAYSIAIVVADDKGKLFFEQKPYNSFAQIYFGGDTLPASARVEVPLDTKPSVLHWKVTVTDRTTKKSTEIKGLGKVLPADFGLIRIGTFADVEAKVPTPPVGVVGGLLYLDFAVVGFARGKDKQPDIKVGLRILDEKGKPTTAASISGEINKGVGDNVRIVPMQFGLTLDRVGRFTLELTARDQIGGKTSTVSLPVRILKGE